MFCWCGRGETKNGRNTKRHQHWQVQKLFWAVEKSLYRYIASNGEYFQGDWSLDILTCIYSYISAQYFVNKFSHLWAHLITKTIWVYSIITSISLVRELKHKESEWFTQGLLATYWQNKDLSPGSTAPDAASVTFTLGFLINWGLLLRPCSLLIAAASEWLRPTHLGCPLPCTSTKKEVSQQMHMGNF